jgi:hypothetical protein
MVELDIEIAKFSEDELTIIVEGDKDRFALNAFGFKKIIQINKQSMYQIV